MTENEFTDRVMNLSDSLVETNLLLQDILSSMDFRSAVQELAERFADRMIELNQEADKLCYEATEIEYNNSMEDEDDD